MESVSTIEVKPREVASIEVNFIELVLIELELPMGELSIEAALMIDVSCIIDVVDISLSGMDVETPSSPKNIACNLPTSITKKTPKNHHSTSSIVLG